MATTMIWLCGLSIVSVCTFRVKRLWFRVLMTIAWGIMSVAMVMQLMSMSHH